MTTDILSLEQFCFDILNQLSDEYNIHDDGSFARAIWVATTEAEMLPILEQLQGNLLIAMQNAIPTPPEKPEFPFGEFDNGNHWQGIF